MLQTLCIRNLPDTDSRYFNGQLKGQSVNGQLFIYLYVARTSIMFSNTGIIAREMYVCTFLLNRIEVEIDGKRKHQNIYIKTSCLLSSINQSN